MSRPAPIPYPYPSTVPGHVEAEFVSSELKFNVPGDGDFFEDVFRLRGRHEVWTEAYTRVGNGPHFTGGPCTLEDSLSSKWELRTMRGRAAWSRLTDDPLKAEEMERHDLDPKEVEATGITVAYLPSVLYALGWVLCLPGYCVDQGGRIRQLRFPDDRQEAMSWFFYRNERQVQVGNWLKPGTVGNYLDSLEAEPWRKDENERARRCPRETSWVLHLWHHRKDLW